MSRFFSYITTVGGVTFMMTGIGNTTLVMAEAGCLVIVANLG